MLYGFLINFPSRQKFKLKVFKKAMRSQVRLCAWKLSNAKVSPKARCYFKGRGAVRYVTRCQL
jgi:hypothetical protein